MSQAPAAHDMMRAMTVAHQGPRRIEFLLVLAVSAWARLAIAPKVLLQRVSPANGDSEYHLRRILMAWEGFPRASVFDPLLGWPHGAAHPWAPGYDWTAGALLRLTGLSDREHLALAAAVFPVLLGLLTVAVVMAIARQVLPAGAHRAFALGAGLLGGLVPQFVGASRLARTDHHVWEAASLALLLWWALGALEGGPRRRFEVLGLLIITATLAGFSGGPLYVALVLPLILARPVLDPEPRTWWGSGAFALAAGAALTALINLGPISEHGRWLSFGYPSLLQPALVLGAAGTVTLAGWSARRTASPVRRLGLIGSFFLVMSGLALITPGLGPQLRAGFSEWLFKKDPWLSGISEFQPLFGVGKSPLEAVRFYLGLTGLAALPLLALAALRGPARRRQLAGFGLVFVTLGALTLLQMRFGRIWAPLTGVAVMVGLAQLPRKWPRAGGLLAASTAFLLAAGDPEVRKELVLSDPRERSPIEAASDALRLDRPPAPGRRDGVLASWDFGHTLLNRAGRPVIASGFGSYVDRGGFEASEAVFEKNEAAMLNLMDERDLGFVVTGVAHLARRPGKAPLLRQGTDGVELNTAAVEERPLIGLAQGGSGLPGVLPHATQLMPVFASAERVPSSRLPMLWAYERVPGVRLSRPCRAGELLVARLAAYLGERPFEWTAWARCGPEGVARLALVVPSGFVAPGFSTGPAWILESSEGREELIVSPNLIRAGAEG